jgi:hypothetical protein
MNCSFCDSESIITYSFISEQYYVCKNYLCRAKTITSGDRRLFVHIDDKIYLFGMEIEKKNNWIREVKNQVTIE